MQEKQKKSSRNQIRKLFDNDHVFWTALALWFFPVLLGLPLLRVIIPNSEVVVILVLLFPIVYVLIPLIVIHVTTRYFETEETSLNTLWEGETL
ncbi:MAG: hypothetical protein ACFFAE_11345 [Candidatus Hodarchaeota archaeon]